MNVLKWIAGSMLVCSLSGCDSSAGLGEACVDEVCAGDAICNADDVCTIHCDSHEDCGCPPGTTNGDIAEGACGLSCTDGQCARVCDLDEECAGETTCGFFSGASLYQTCR